MQVALFKALKSVKIGDDMATAVVGQLEERVESVVDSSIVRFERVMSENITRVEGRLATVEGRLATLEGKFGGFQATLDAMKTQNIFIGILLSIIGLAIAAGPIIAKVVR